MKPNETESGAPADPRLHILHLDMDAFYAAIEQRDHPEWRGRPVVVGAAPDHRGVVATASYEARVFGIRSAMPSRTAGRLCPQAIFVAPRMDHYVEVSGQVMTILREVTPILEPLSLDEAFLDVSGVLRQWQGDSVRLARTLMQRIRDRLHLTASVGVAVNKFLAKVASDLRKPDGLTVVPADPEAILEFLAPLPASRIWGLGPKTAAHLKARGLTTIGHLQALDRDALRAILGVTMADHVWALCRGQDDRPVETEWDEKSLSNEQTYDTDCADLDQVRQTLVELTQQVGMRLRRAGKTAGTARIKVRLGDFTTHTRQVALPQPTAADRDLLRAALELFERAQVREPVRLIGFGVSQLAEVRSGEPEQPELFALPPDARRERDRQLDDAVDRLRDRLGPDALRRGDWRRG